VIKKPQTHNADLRHLPPALLPLTEQKRWVVWDWELRKSKWTKPPRQAGDPSRNARSNDPATWSSYDTAVSAVLAGNAAGVGFMLSGSNIGAGDLDHVRDPESGTVEPWAEQLCEEANGAYREITVSGAGVRVVGKCAGPEVHRKFTFDRKTGAGVELYRDCARYITVSGLEIGACPELPPLDAFIDTLFERFSGRTKKTDNLDFNDVSQQMIDYDDLIQNGVPEGERSELFQSCVWHLANQGWTTEQITDELARHPNGIGRKYADRLHAEVERSYAKWQACKRTAVTGDATAAVNDPWPQIRVVPSELPRVVNDAENALLLGQYGFYQRGGLVVRPTQIKLGAANKQQTSAWQLITVESAHLVETFTRAARFLKWDGRSRAWLPIDCPDKVAKTYLARSSRWQLPVLFGVVGTPMLERDGSILEQPGYTAANKLLLDVGDVFPAIPQFPTKDEGAAALRQIEQLIASFPFVTPADKSVALSAILTALDHYSMATVPMHAFTSPTAGTGKSLLVDVVSTLATGNLMPVVAQGYTDEELEKRLGAMLLAGDGLVSIDNCDRPLQGAFLAQVLSQEYLMVRPLGRSERVLIPVTTVVYATGNNLVIAGDLTRRTMLCSLDAHCEHPEQRSFASNVINVARRDRSRLVVAALTALRAWHVANQPRRLRAEGPPLGSFEDWSYRIREPLLWLGYADSCDTMIKTKDSDPARLALMAVLAQWRANLGTDASYTVQEVINRSINVSDFHVALTNVAGDRTGVLVNNQRLGRWLKRVEGQIIDGLALKRTGIIHGYPLWRLICS
jgi:hypothetical protein